MPELASGLVNDWLSRRSSVIAEISASGRELDAWWKKTGRRAFWNETRNSSVALSGHNAPESHQARLTRFARMANGATPAVIKVAGFGGGAGTQRLISYISRDGRLPVETETGRDLSGRHVAADLARDWSPLFRDAEKSKDVGLFKIDIVWRAATVPSLDQNLSVVRDLFGDRTFAIAVAASAHQVRIEALVVLLSPSQGRLSVDDKANAALDTRLRFSLGNRALSASIVLKATQHGLRHAASALDDLVQRNPHATFDHNGRPIGDKAQAKQIMQQDWRSKLGSRSPRDTLHLIVSGSEKGRSASFEPALRQFLAQEFQGYRYVFAIHSPESDPKSQHKGGRRPHLHAHVVVATRSSYGDRLAVWIDDLNRWRRNFAEAARNHGMAMELTHRHEMLSAPAFGYRDVKPIGTLGRTQHQGTSVAAQRRYDAKRSDEARLNRGEVAKSRAIASQKLWLEIANGSGSPVGRQFSQRILSRFEALGFEAATGQRQGKELSQKGEAKPMVSRQPIDAAGAGREDNVERSSKRHSEEVKQGEARLAAREQEQSASSESSPSYRQRAIKAVFGTGKSRSDSARTAKDDVRRSLETDIARLAHWGSPGNADARDQVAYPPKSDGSQSAPVEQFHQHSQARFGESGERRRPNGSDRERNGSEKASIAQGPHRARDDGYDRDYER
ncbi:hypothetical protein [Neorhizobium sp. NCHU2750]|uniref:hypothetical protein n=1 Tax=Neorhizobium sp. NCHU2750 TaxID=1825976 RepID=UPI000E74296F|nr:hypothetical protein NCHU2750_11720 [Neorhizobium sp. NCHU2750]